MKTPHFILILCCSLATACSSGDPRFPTEERLAEELLPLQGMNNPFLVEVKPPFLIIQNNKMNDSIYHIYDLASHEFKSAFGKIGEGPGEFVLPWLLQTQSPSLLICSSTQIHRFDINKEGLPTLKDVRQIGYENGMYSPAFINDSLYVVDAMYTGPDVYLFDLQDESPKKTWRYRNPDILDYFVDPDMGNIYANESRIVFCYGYKKQIDYMDTEFNLIKRVKFNYDHPSEINGETDKASYAYGYLGKRYFYTVFFGRSWNEYRANPTHGVSLEVFDLDGNPIARYQLAGRRPAYFAVDEETFTLYGAGEDGDPEDNLLVYKLKGLS